MNKIILVDSGYWIGLLDSSDQHHKDALKIASIIEEYKIIIPWPCLYETISTRMIRKRNHIILFEQYLAHPNINLIEDNEYKITALDQVFLFNRQLGFSYSLTDSVIREMLRGINIRIDFFVTFNRNDFSDICAQRQIEIIDSM